MLDARTLGAAGFAALTIAISKAPAQAPPPEERPLVFSITCDSDVASEHSGRVYVMCGPAEGPEPRFGPGWFSQEPFLSVDILSWETSQPLVINPRHAVNAYPGSISAWPRGEYQVQAVIRFNPDSPRLGRGEGNAYSKPVRATMGEGLGGTVDLVIDQVVPDRRPPRGERVEAVVVYSDLLMEFHGRPVAMRAAVLLPEGYGEDPDRRYPAMYWIGGFGSDHHAVAYLGRHWSKQPRADDIVRVVLDPLCYGGHHVFADSANNGPRARALVEELIPHLESKFRLVSAPNGRFLSGVSSGGWSSLWLQITHPDFFGGTWSIAPDPVDFSRFQLADIYRENANLFEDADGNTLALAQHNGQPFATTRDFAAMERVLGDGGQLRSFEWVFSPQGEDGLPAPLYDRDTGVIDPAVAEAWKAYDIRLILERDWETLGPRLAGKINVFCGDQDTFYLHTAVETLQATLASLDADAVVELVPGADHSSIMSPALMRRIDEEMLEAFEPGAVAVPVGAAR